jgi:CheY-like chemotaxis protein
LSKAAILIVDDDEDILYFLSVLLEENGYKVDTANTGQEALEKAVTTRYDLVLLDYKVTDMYGEVIAEELVQIDESIQIIYITGYSLNGQVPRNKLVREVLVKPIPDHVLLETISNIVYAQDVPAE